MQDRARFLTSTGVQTTFIGDEQNNESVTRKKGVEGGLFHVVLGTSESFIDVTDGDPYLQVQLTKKGFGWVPLMKAIVSDTAKN